MISRFNTKTLVTIIVFLVVLNLSTIGTIVYHIYFSGEENGSEVVVEQVDVPDRGLGRFFRQQLDLTPQQHVQFRNFRREFHAKANKVTNELQEKRNEFMTELGKEHSDTKKLHKLSEEIGELHAELKHLTFEYYLQMKSVCDREQQEKLYIIFRSMMNPGEESTAPGSLKNEIQNKQMFN